jgi:hypothetical protein
VSPLLLCAERRRDAHADVDAHSCPLFSPPAPSNPAVVQARRERLPALAHRVDPERLGRRWRGGLAERGGAARADGQRLVTGRPVRLLGARARLERPRERTDRKPGPLKTAARPRSGRGGVRHGRHIVVGRHRRQHQEIGEQAGAAEQGSRRRSRCAPARGRRRSRRRVRRRRRRSIPFIAPCDIGSSGTARPPCGMTSHAPRAGRSRACMDPKTSIHLRHASYRAEPCIVGLGPFSSWRNPPPSATRTQSRRTARLRPPRHRDRAR